MHTYGICIDGQTEPYVLSPERDWLTDLADENRKAGHSVELVEREMPCVICTDPIDWWVWPDDAPTHDDACRSEYEAWRMADLLGP